MKEFLVAAKAAITQTPNAAGLSVSAIFTAIAAAFGKIPIILILFKIMYKNHSISFF